MNNSIFKLENVIQNYVWGSQTAITELFGIDNPEQVPQAEIWMGTHPNGCSKLAHTGMLLSDFIQSDPANVLGDYTVERFGDLPFLFKVLSAEKPLSIQVHPSREKAIEGYQKENLQGLQLTDSSRNYKDDNHKPELVYALTFYKAMNGFRTIEEIVSLFDQAKVETLRVDLEKLILQPTSTGLKAFFDVVMNLSAERKQRALAELLQAVDQPAKTAKAREAFELIKEFRQDYRDDIGLFSPLLLNIVELEPGEAMFLHAETPHAYVKGTGLEIMANSDNVLRAGLTPKHMDIAELIANTNFISTDRDKLILKPFNIENKTAYPIPVEDFSFEIVNVETTERRQYVRSAEILFCIEGNCAIRHGSDVVTVAAGESVFVCNSTKVYEYFGEGRLARAFN
ncbi:mannose-6-phosphate isomerase, class I [Vibrio vulnificus]|jgi:mannose-6-phosphate isomerase|uniref:mannose-6-phosphate isomerase, class I n=1 Tax=Vibrio TaxID=662 RepID=UPI0005FBA500|nr:MULTISPECIES: mannose-6-phosphate isomerase, class I [Vibrio]EHK2774044.1 mannose-6-phosphate isomerase, class I [Vibrio vulnificus]EHK9000001.1 mannose-6-phosphate isomerase, class I [Vibrio vulnificus]EHU9470256.1 mannose-6-phosphate isomerase, class I [Vibrio vulnificus]EIA1771872.1 mannose-6-phosphate isomerase, class I [Vibrio vulnificus]EIT7020783.1 mannose-6-phosphate isomerase, class I [Vibrio vulnificus]